MRKNKKHSVDFKLAIIQRILCGQNSIRGEAIEHSLAFSMVRRWVKQFEKYGVLSLQSKPYSSYSPSFKLEVLNTIKEEDLSLMKAILRFNLPNQSLIVDWRKKFETYGLEGLKPRLKGRPRMNKNDKLPNKRKKSAAKGPLSREEQLEKENEYLRAENALLKKLQALVQKDNRRKP